MLRTSLFKKVVFLGALAIASIAQADFEYRIPIRGLALGAGATPPTTLSSVGDGLSKVGACASGAATGCATWNPSESKNVSFSNENLTVSLTGSIAAEAVGSSAKTDGKWYWELTIMPASTGGAVVAGVMEANYITTGSWATDVQATWVKFAEMRSCGNSWGGWVYMNNDWNTVNGDVLGYALDMPSRTLSVYKNGGLLGVLCANLPAAVKPFVSYGAGAQTTLVLNANFGQANFAYPVPAGYNAGLW